MRSRGPMFLLSLLLLTMFVVNSKQLSPFRRFHGSTELPAAPAISTFRSSTISARRSRMRASSSRRTTRASSRFRPSCWERRRRRNCGRTPFAGHDSRAAADWPALQPVLPGTAGQRQQLQLCRHPRPPAVRSFRAPISSRACSASSRRAISAATSRSGWTTISAWPAPTPMAAWAMVI